MKFFNYIFLLFFTLNTSFTQLFSQQIDSILKNNIYNSNIHTVLLHPVNNPLSYPIIHLGTEEKLQISFDDFNEELKDYYYTIIHCNSDWTPSDLM